MGTVSPLAEREGSSHPLFSPPAEGGAKEKGKALYFEKIVDKM
jgi:hypothetical protein